MPDAVRGEPFDRLRALLRIGLSNHERPFDKLRAKDVGRIPVVDRNDTTKLLGVLRRHDIIRAYRKKLEEGVRRDRGY